MKAHVLVEYPNGGSALGYNVRGRARGPLTLPQVGWVNASPDPDGSHSVSLNVPSGRNIFEFEANGQGAGGVSWEGKAVVKWNLVRVRQGEQGPRREVRVLLSRKRREVETKPDATALARLSDLDSDGLVLLDLGELMDALSASLPGASLAMAGKVLEGLIKTKARKEKWWSDDWDKMPLGTLLENSTVKNQLVAVIGTGGWDRLRGSTVFLRNVGVHHKHEAVSMEEALATARVVYDFMGRW